MRPPALATTCLRSAPPHHLSLDAPPTFAKAGTHNLGIGACRHVFQVTPTLVSIYLLGLCHGAWRRATLMYHTYSNTAHRTRGTAGEGSLRTHTDEDILNHQAPFVVGSRPHSQIRTHPYLLRGKFDLWRSRPSAFIHGDANFGFASSRESLYWPRCTGNGYSNFPSAKRCGEERQSVVGGLPLLSPSPSIGSTRTGISRDRINLFTETVEGFRALY